MKMNRGLLLTATVSIGSFLHGWVYLLLFGYPSYMKEELNLESELAQDSLVWFVSSIGILLAALSGRMGGGRMGGIGRRPLLVMSSLLYLFCSVVMLWSKDPTLILVSRFLDGFAMGFSYILVLFYFMETAPRGFLRLLLPQLSSLCGVSLCFMVFEMPLGNWPGWKLMLDVAFSLSLLYFVLVVFCLPESPKWLVRKGRIDEARHILQLLRGSLDVSDEMYLLVYSLRLEGASSIEDLNDEDLEYGPRDLSSDNLSKPVKLSAASQQGSLESQNATLTDSLLTHSGNGNFDEDSLTRERDDSMPNADASVLTIRVSK